MAPTKAHALLSASGASRWVNCPPSARLEENIPDSTTSYADEGSLAHEIAEVLIKKRLGLISTQAFNKAMKGFEKNDLYQDDMLDFMEDFSIYVTEVFVAAQKQTPDAICLTEQRLDFSEYAPEGFGTGDVIIIADGTLNIIDLKYGKGVQVDAQNNVQMMLYALGAISEYDYLYGIEKVQMTIYQPRLDNISVWEAGVQQLKDWGKTVLEPRAQLAFKGEGDFAAGKHCKFCKVKNRCREYVKAIQEFAAEDFKGPVFLTDQEMSELLKTIIQIEPRIKSIRDYAYSQALEGKKWEGFKLVEGRSNRKYADQELVSEKLTKAGFKEEDIYSKELKGITAMEKLVGKKKFAALLSGLITRPPGKPALVENSDSRPELPQAEDDFDDGFQVEPE